MPVTGREYVETLPLLGTTTKFDSMSRSLYGLYSRFYRNSSIHCTSRDDFAFMLGLDEEEVPEKPWLRDTAKSQLCTLPACNI
jgi:hypothetical protein